MRHLGLFIMTGILAISSFACGGQLQGGSEFGNPSKLSLSIIGYQSSLPQAATLQSLAVNDLTVDSAQMVFGSIIFKPIADCIDTFEEEETDDILFEGPFIVDLLQTDTIEELENATVTSGIYCRIELRLKKLESNIMSDDLILGRSVLITGNRADDTPFLVSLEVDEEFKLENESTGFTVGTIADATRLFIAFDLNRWFSGVDLDDPGVEVGSDGDGLPLIMIDADHNTELQEQIIENLKLSSDLFEDKDEDDSLDAEEQEDSLASGELII